MLTLSLAAAVLFASPSETPQIQERPGAVPAPVAAPGADDPVDLGDIVVVGRNLRDSTEQYVREVGAPARGRGLARWRDGVCVGVANMQADAAQYIVDRVSDVARELGLSSHEPPCHPSILIVATTEASAFTQEFVDMRPRLFRTGASGSDRGGAALQDFIATDRPVRWWTVSIPVNAEDGVIAVRVPGRMTGDGSSVFDYAPVIDVAAASRLTTQIIDDAKRSFVILDMDRMGDVTLPQLADYVAMVSLTQVNPEGDTSRFASILNLFDDPSGVTGLTDWDMAYLRGVYDAERTRKNQASYEQEVATSIIRAHHDIQAEADARADPAGTGGARP